MQLDALVAFYETLDEAGLARLGELYTPDARFKDPFNDVQGVAAIRRIFSHMFRQVAAPRFVVSGRVVDAGGAVLLWSFHFRFRPDDSREQTIHGVSHLLFAPDGRVCLHRDYWDAAEELYMKLPLVGALMRLLRRRLAARQPGASAPRGPVYP